MTSWRLLARGQVVMEAPRHVMIQDTINIGRITAVK